MDFYDILIIGAGPAGSFAAEKLSATGRVKVALVDGRFAGEPKACGGGVTSKALKAWPHLNQVESRTINEVEMCAPSGRSVLLKLDQPFAIYSRRALDAYLRRRAEASGAEILNDRATVLPRSADDAFWTVQGATTGVMWKAKYVVAADGANSAFAKRAAGPLKPSEMEVAFGYRTPLPKSSDVVTSIAFLPGWAGYAWAFPRLDHISFGIATAQDAFDHSALDRLLWDFMVGYYRRLSQPNIPVWSSGSKRRPKSQQDSVIEDKLKTSAERYAARIPGLSPEVLKRRKSVGDGWALLGDAAGFADPVTGEGIYYALRSAELFAEAYLNGHPEAYEANWRDDFGRELIRASQMRGRFYGKFMGTDFTEVMVKLARTHPGIRRTLRNLVAGDQGYVDLKGKLVRRSLCPF